MISSTRAPTPQTLLRRQDVVVSAADVEGVHLEPVQGIAVSGTVKVEGVNSGTWPTVALTAPPGQSRNDFRHGIGAGKV